MATTAAAMLFGRAAPVVAHVGDSRIYLWRSGALQQVTEDHSWVSEQVRAGVMSERDARRHPWRNVVTRAIAGGEDPEIEVAEVEVRSHDRIVLCSDGLHGVVSPDRLGGILAKRKGLAETCQMLIDAANDAGGPDNITVAVLQVDVE
jgi:PPM family protein phosphatase